MVCCLMHAYQGRNCTPFFRYDRTTVSLSYWMINLTSPPRGINTNLMRWRLLGWGMSARKEHFTCKQKGTWLEWKWGLRCMTHTMMSMMIHMIHRMLEPLIMTQLMSSSLSRGTYHKQHFLRKFYLCKSCESSASRINMYRIIFLSRHTW